MNHLFSLSNSYPSTPSSFVYTRELEHARHTRIIDCHSAHIIQSHVCACDGSGLRTLGLCPSRVSSTASRHGRNTRYWRDTRDSFHLNITLHAHKHATRFILQKNNITRARARNTQHLSRLSLLSLTLTWIMSYMIRGCNLKRRFISHHVHCSPISKPHL